MSRIFSLFLLCLALSAFAKERSLFANPDIRSSYSPMLQKKNAVYDSLLPALDGDKAFQDLVRGTPKLWSLDRLDKLGDVVTRLKVEVIYLDGVREEQFCEINKSETHGSDLWSVRMGVDFTSGESNTVPVHVQQCLDFVRNELGYKVKKGGRVVEVPAKKILDEIKKSNIPAALDPDLQAKVLSAHRQVNITGQCPTDIEAYAILLDVWDQVKGLPTNIAAMNDRLNPEFNGDRKVHSCAFSREWNQKYSEESSLLCDEAKMWCKYSQSEDGTTRWQLDPASDAFVFQPFLGLFGGKSIHKGGGMLDLRILALSNAMFLEAYLDEKGFPISLGLITVPEK
jgi:hypothetical protein